MIERLIKKISEENIQTLIEASLSFKTGETGFGAYYEFIKKLCRENDVSLQQTPRFADYLQYVLLAESIDADTLLKDARALEENVFQSLARTEAEKKLIQNVMDQANGEIISFALDAA